MTVPATPVKIWVHASMESTRTSASVPKDGKALSVISVRSFSICLPVYPLSVFPFCLSVSDSSLIIAYLCLVTPTFMWYDFKRFVNDFTARYYVNICEYSFVSSLSQLCLSTLLRSCTVVHNQILNTSKNIRHQINFISLFIPKSKWH